MPLIRYYILENDTTTAGGIVQTTTNPIVFDVDGKKQSCIGDDVWCSACQSVGKIVPTGPRLSFSLGGAMPALNDDLCLCKCTPPPKLVHSQTSFKEIIDDNKIVEYVEYVSKLKKQISTPIQNNFVPKGAYSASGLQEDSGCPPECIVDIVEFNTNPGPYIISKEMWDMIIEFEKYYETPYHPGDSSSGVTLAIGYDLGQQSAERIRQDLKQFYTQEQINRLLVAQGKKGNAAKSLVAQLQDIKISYDKAIKLAVQLKTRYAQDTLSIYPQVLNLHPHCQGVLLSLVFNRGTSLKDKSGSLTKRHMREIQEALRNNKPETIPDILRDMSKLWTKTGKQGNSGVGVRRRKEADIFERGLKCDCYQ